MIRRCPNCRKLYPKHHDECGYCAMKGNIVAEPVEASATASTEAEEPIIDENIPQQESFEAYNEAPAEEQMDELDFGAAPEDLGAIENQVTTTWNDKQGGLCPECQVFNPPTVPFCKGCGTMLLKSEATESSVTSYSLKKMKGMIPTFIDKLAKLKVKKTSDILRVGLSKKNRDMITKNTGMSERSILQLVHNSNFCRISEVGPDEAACFELAGIRQMQDFLDMGPDKAYGAMQNSKRSINDAGILVLPTKGKLTTWHEEAAGLPPLNIE